MGIDIGTQIIIALIFGFMALLTKKNFPEISRYFTLATITLFTLFSILDVIDILSLIK